MEAKKGKVYFTANDLDVSLTTILDCDVQAEGKIAVPGKKFFEIVRSLPEDTVDIDVDGEKVSVKCRRSRFRMVGKGADEFPKLPEQKPMASFSMDTKIVDDMVSKTIYAVSNDLTRPALCGVLWEVKKDNFAMVATDGHRLSLGLSNSLYQHFQARSKCENCIVNVPLPCVADLNEVE